MTNNSSDRLDRIEALAESNAKAIEALANQTNEAIQALAAQTASNAKSIQALADQAAEDRRDRVRMYDAMADLASAQSTLASAQSAFYRRLEAQDELVQTLSRRQGEIVQILKVLSDRQAT